MENKASHPSDFQTVSLLIPIMILIGVYLIMNGHISPGGGFQGGAALAAVIVSHFLIDPNDIMETKQLKVIEKYIYVVLTVSATLYVITGLHLDFLHTYEWYMIAMNTLLGAKVFCGLTIIFVEFAMEFQ